MVGTLENGRMQKISGRLGLRTELTKRGGRGKKHWTVREKKGETENYS